MMDDDTMKHDAVAGAFNMLARICNDASTRAGWWTDAETGLDMEEAAGRWYPFVIATKLMLQVSEICEGMEGHRSDKMDDKLPHRSMLEVELADAVIRIADLAGRLKLDVGGAIAEKMAFNTVRKDHRPEERAKKGGKKY